MTTLGVRGYFLNLAWLLGCDISGGEGRFPCDCIFPWLVVRR